VAVNKPWAWHRGINAFNVQDYKTARTLLEPCALEGDVLAQFGLGCTYAYEFGVEKDIELACHWLGKAARQGYARAQFQFASVLNRHPELLDEVKAA